MLIANTKKKFKMLHLGPQNLISLSTLLGASILTKMYKYLESEVVLLRVQNCKYPYSK